LTTTLASSSPLDFTYAALAVKCKSGWFPLGVWDEARTPKGTTSKLGSPQVHPTIRGILVSSISSFPGCSKAKILEKESTPPIIISDNKYTYAVRMRQLF